MNHKSICCVFFLVLLFLPPGLMAVRKEREVRHERQIAFPPVYMWAVVSPQVYAVLLATYGLALLIRYGVQRASSDSHSCANNRGWCRQSCFSHEYVDGISSAVCGRYKCCRPKTFG